MTRYRIELAQTVIEKAIVWLEASTAAEAERRALKESRFADWGFADAYGDIEIISVEEMKT